MRHQVTGNIGPAPANDRLWRWMATLLIAVAVFNAMFYVARFANPVLSSDYWYFLDAFVREVRGGTLDALDFFVKRGGGLDHAQPLKKLVLLANVQLADLDLAFDAMVGFGFALVCLVMLHRLLSKGLPEQRADAFHAFSTGALAASLLTLNAGMMFDNSLVALEFGTYIAILLAVFAAWRTLEGGSWASYIISLVLLSVVADDTALLATAVIVLCSVFFAIKRRHWRRALMVAGAALLAHAVYLHTLGLLLPQRGSVQAMYGITGSSRIALLLAQDQWLAFFTVPLASSLAHLDQLKFWSPRHLVAATWLLAGVGAIFQGLFWYRALRGRLDQTVFVAIALMLVLYAYVAGILYGRVPIQGAIYLNQPRYVFFYLLSNVALVLMAAAEYRQPSDSRGRGKRVAMIVVVSLLVLQLPLSVYTWKQGKYVVHYQSTMEQQLLQLPAVPAAATPTCVPILVVCQYTPARRIEAIRYLQQQRLNVFSENFRRRHETPAQ